MAIYTDAQKKQIVLDTIAAYQTRESCARAARGCFYRSGDPSDKRKCAVGRLMPDDAPHLITRYTGSVQSLIPIINAYYMHEQMPDWAQDIRDNVQFLMLLQKSHDNFSKLDSTYVSTFASITEALRSFLPRYTPV